MALTNARQTQLSKLWIRAFAFVVAFAIAVTSFLPVRQAAAQDRPKTIVDMLFGSRAQAEKPRQTIKKRVIRKKKVIRKKRAPSEAKTRSNAENPSVTRRAPARSAPAAAETATQAEPKPDPEPSAAAASGKSENAKTVLVVGDFMADSLADGLEASYAEDGLIAVTNRTSGSSGLVREDHYDWSEKLGPIIDETEPDVLAVMIGANDRQPMRVSGGILSVRSDGWTAEYEKRATDIAKIAQEKNVPLLWVGMPSFKYDSMSEDMVFLNDIYKRAAERASGEFVSVWDGFVDEQGNFVYSGPDVNGQNSRLRGSDGLTMTDTGEEKLAFFTRKALGRMLGEVSPQIALGDESLPVLQLQPLSNAASAQVAAPVSLDDPSFDGSDALLGTGSSQTAFSLEMSPRDRLVLNGDPVNVREGRADNFAWNAKSSAIRSEPTVIYRGSIDLKTINDESGITPPKEMPTIFDAIIEDWEASDGNDAPEGSSEEAAATEEPSATEPPPAGGENDGATN